MKKYFLVPAILLTLSFFAFRFSKNPENKSGQGFAVIELFTSEGCSSCPAADDAVAEIAKQSKNNVFILGYHVDYWNYLGWKDAFSNSAYSDRQKQYANVFRLNSIYTPQIVVNGKTEFVGSDKNKLQQTIAKELSMVMMRPFDVSARALDDKTITVDVKMPSSPNDIINIALVQLQAQSSVKRGENSGRQLHHINIVRELKTIDPSTKQPSINFILPGGMTKKDFTVIVFSQNRNNLQIDNAAQVNIQ